MSLCLMPIKKAVETLNAHKHRGRQDWFWNSADGEVQTSNDKGEGWQRPGYPIHPVDAAIIAAYYWHGMYESDAVATVTENEK